MLLIHLSLGQATIPNSMVATEFHASSLLYKIHHFYFIFCTVRRLLTRPTPWGDETHMNFVYNKCIGDGFVRRPCMCSQVAVHFWDEYDLRGKLGGISIL